MSAYETQTEGRTDTEHATVDEGDRVRITNAQIATNRDGVEQLEVCGVCDVEVVLSRIAKRDKEALLEATDDGFRRL